MCQIYRLYGDTGLYGEIANFPGFGQIIIAPYELKGSDDHWNCLMKLYYLELYE